MASSNRKPGILSNFKYSLGEASINGIAIASLIALGCAAAYNLYIYNQVYARLFPVPWAILQRALSTAIWALVQLIEVFPILLNNELGLMALVAIAISLFPRASISDSDNPAVARLRDRWNTFPERFIYGAGLLAFIVYLLDLAGVFSHFMPITLSMGLPRLNFGALIQSLATVFIVQSLVGVALWANGGALATRIRSQPNWG